jgi:hypothetical protein
MMPPPVVIDSSNKFGNDLPTWVQDGFGDELPLCIGSRNKLPTWHFINLNDNKKNAPEWWGGTNKMKLQNISRIIPTYSDFKLAFIWNIEISSNLIQVAFIQIFFSFHFNSRCTSIWIVNYIVDVPMNIMDLKKQSCKIS